MTPAPAKVNVALLTDCLADLAGGAEKQIYELARRLDKNACNVFVVSLDSWGQAPRGVIEATGSRLHVFKVVRIYGLSGLVQGLRFRRFLRRNRIDVLLTYHFSSDMWGTFWGRLAGVPRIMSNRRDMGFWRDEWHVRAYKLLNPWVCHIITVTNSIKEMVIRTEGFDAKRIEVVYNGVDLPPVFAPDIIRERAKLGLAGDDVVVMHVANLKPVKAHEFLLKAAADLTAQFPKLRLVLIGKDELDGGLQRMAKELKIEAQVKFLGKRDDISRLLALSDICVLPSLSEGMSNAILEYMAAGKPVIATNVGGNPELVRNGDNGILVGPSDAVRLKHALAELIKDPDKRRRMGQNGRQRAVNEFSMAAMMARYQSILGIAPAAAAAAAAGGVKVLHLISSGGLFGAEQVILNLAGRLSGVECFIGAVHNLHNPHLEIIDRAKAQGSKCAVFDSRGPFDPGTVKAVKNFILENAVDIVHTHNYKSDVIGFFARRGTGAKWVATNHLWHSRDPKLQVYEGLDAFFLKFADQITAVSAEIHKDLVRKGFDPRRLQVVDNGIALEPFEQAFPLEQLRAGLGLSPSETGVVLVGRLEQEKAHDIFLKAAVGVRNQTKSVKFFIVGDGPLRGRLEQMAKDLHVADCVTFTGIRRDMPQLYAACDIVVNCSYMEGLPMTVLEAMASRKAIIATKVGAIPKVLSDGRSGLLLEPGDFESLARAILELVMDPAKRRRLGEEARAEASARFSAERMAGQYAEIYARLLT